ncbi:MAG: putative cysteine desulfurase [Berkelbacteria bacterium GW2011_GWA1_39_10]|uniref:cysteine desulfurase n=1 Tax=Berkelbacteria bacterium GW2011_GWA1_39_10 TaxID=1618332 RepID=A0A0G0PLY2_9BACT|nr:MAG: putative cysteine desulfurase [Berkelbacteria bacterium GW2011_GWA1_39_10]
MKVYLDYGATTPVKSEVLTALLPYLKENFGNPSSIHEWGRIARAAVDEAREKTAKFLNADAAEIVFTSGGTEADNLAIRGLIRNPLEENGGQLGNQKIENSQSNNQSLISKPISNFQQPFSLPHIITSQIEHHAVLNTCKALEKEGLAEVTYIKPNRDGIIETEKIKKAIKKNTVLVSIMYVNNEIGTVQPIREIGKMIEKENSSRLAVGGKRIYFHTDAVQAAEYLPMDVDFLHVDLLTISGHKIGASKGIGALYIKKGTPIKNISFGGEQEMGFRAGTENITGIIALGKAVSVINQKSEISFESEPEGSSLRVEDRNQKIKGLRDYLINKVLKEISEVELNGSKELRSPNNANFYFKYIEGESIVIAMDLEGVGCSTGSACTSQSLEPSHVIMATYSDPKRAAGSVRFTLGDKTTKEELDYAVKKIRKVVDRLREISPYGGNNDN